MIVVINIDDNLYTRLFDCPDNTIEDMDKACTAIRNGTVLAKRHADVATTDKGMCYECPCQTKTCQEGLHCPREVEE